MSVYFLDLIDRWLFVVYVLLPLNTKIQTREIKKERESDG